MCANDGVLVQLHASRRNFVRRLIPAISELDSSPLNGDSFDYAYLIRSSLQTSVNGSMNPACLFVNDWNRS
jgi:hypothetical protein